MSNKTKKERTIFQNIHYQHNSSSKRNPINKIQSVGATHYVQIYINQKLFFLHKKIVILYNKNT